MEKKKAHVRAYMQKSYLLAQLKRIWKVLPFVLGMSLLMAAAILFLAVAMQQEDTAQPDTAQEADTGQRENSKSERRNQKIKIAISGDTQDPYLRVGIFFLRQMKDVRYSIDIELMSEAEARRELRAGNISAYILVPEGFAEAAYRNEDVQLTYATTNDTAGVGSIIMNELIDTISLLAKKTQNAIQGLWQLMPEYGVEGDYAEHTDSLSLRMVQLIVKRGAFYRFVKYGVGDGLSLKGYYCVALLVLFLILWGITGSSLFVRRDAALPKLLKSRGQSALMQIAAEYAAYFLLMLGSMFLMLLPVESALAVAGITIPEAQGAGLFLLWVRMIPAAMLLAVMQFCLYELTTDMISGILLQFLMGIALGYLSGCIYPISFFPKSVQAVAPFLPTGAAVEYGAQCMRGASGGRALAVMSLYFVLFFALTVLVRERRTKA